MRKNGQMQGVNVCKFSVNAHLRLIVWFVIQQISVVLKNGQNGLLVLSAFQAVFFEQGIEMRAGKT